MHQEKQKAGCTTNGAISLASPLKSLLVHLSCGMGVSFGFWIAFNLLSINFIQDPARTLCMVWVVELLITVLVYSLFRKSPDQCSYLRAITRGLLSLPAGALVNAFGAIVLGAPVGLQQLPKTLHWSLLMSTFTFVPAACVYGASWSDWNRIYVRSKPTGVTDFMVSLPAHGAVIGAWFGAWPMPLDWERPWQEWPICVTYGAVTGYIVGMVLPIVLSVAGDRKERLKME